MTNFSFRPLVAALALAGIGAANAADVSDAPSWSFSGFGTFSAVHSNDDTSDFLGTLFQPNGAGHTRATSTTPDSKLGLQLGAVFNPQLSAVVQVVSQYQYDSSYTPMVEWANVKYQVTPELAVRLGRIAAPSYLLSESRFVGYTNASVRPPTEVYGVLAITSNDGIDATYRSQIAGANNTVQAYYGKSSVNLTSGGAKSRPSWGVNDTVDIGALSLRAGYNSLKIDLDIPSLAGLFAGFRAFGEQDMLEKYKLDGMKTSALSLGATYDPGDWFVVGEFVDYKGAGFLSDTRSWYANAGYRVGKFTPYVGYSNITSHIKAESDAGFLNAGVNTTLNAFTPTQHTTSIGLRWDVMKNVALKTQFDRIKTGENSSGRLRSFPGYVPGSNVDVVTVAADFVF
jgi:hypothetical protein